MKLNIDINILKTLYKKELRGQQDSLVGHMVIIVLAYTIRLLGARRWEPEGIFVFASLPFSLLPFWFLFTSFDLIKKEWKEQTVTLWKNIPTPSTYLLGAKFLALWTEFLLLGLMILGGFFLVVTIQPIIILQDYTIFNGILLIFQLLIILVPVTAFIFLIYVSGVSLPAWDFLVRVPVSIGIIGSIVVGTFIFGIFLGGSELFFTINMPTSASIGESAAITAAGPLFPLHFLISYYITAVISFIAAAWFLEERPYP